MKPKPLASVNHFTVPVVRIAECPEEWGRLEERRASRRAERRNKKGPLAPAGPRSVGTCPRALHVYRSLKDNAWTAQGNRARPYSRAKVQKILTRDHHRLTPLRARRWCGRSDAECSSIPRLSSMRAAAST